MTGSAMMDFQMRYRLRTLLIAIADLAMALACTHPTLAENEADPSGTFTWRFANQSAVQTLKLKLDGGKLTGTIKNSQSAPESPIEDAAFKNGAVSFKHTYKARDGKTTVANYTGTITPNGIKGTIEIKHPDRTISREWDANRVKE
jgi:hypothetical protein